MMSGNSIISLIIFLSLIAFAGSGSIPIMLLTGSICCAIWVNHTCKKPNAHFQKLANDNAEFSQAGFLTETNLSHTQLNAMITELRNQMPRSTRTIALRPENHLYDDLQIDPVKLELDIIPKLCNELSLHYEIDPQNPLSDSVTTLKHLSDFIASRKPIT